MTNSRHESRIENSLTFNDVMDEALAEHEAQKAAEKKRQEAEEETRREERCKVEQEERRKKNVANSRHLRKIAESIMPDHREGKAPRKRTWVIDEENFKLTIDGIDVSWMISFEKQWTNVSAWRSKPTGKMKFVIGDFGERRTYPERKDGTFNYVDIAGRLCLYADRKNSQLRMERQRKQNASEVIDVTMRIFPDPERSKYQDVILASADPDKPVFFKFKIERAMTAEQAEKLAAAIRSVGIKLHYSDEE